MRFHVMLDDRTGSETLLVCRASREAAVVEASRALRERDTPARGLPVVTWVEPATDCGHP